VNNREMPDKFAALDSPSSSRHRECEGRPNSQASFSARDRNGERVTETRPLALGGLRRPIGVIA